MITTQAGCFKCKTLLCSCVTPIPWKIAEPDGGDYYKIFPQDSNCKGYPLAKIIMGNKFIKESPHSNAQYIVHCANNYPKLESLNLEFLKNAEQLVYDWENADVRFETIERFKALVAKAKGGG